MQRDGWISKCLNDCEMYKCAKLHQVWKHCLWLLGLWTSIVVSCSKNHNKIKRFLALFSFLCTHIFTLDSDSEILCFCFMFLRQHNAKRHYVLTYLLLTTFSMQLSPTWKASRFSTSQEIPRIFWNPKTHYHLSSAHHLSLFSASSIQSMPPSDFTNLPSTPGSSKWSLSLGLPQENPVCTSRLPHTCYKPRPSNSSWFYQQNNIC